MFDGRSKNVIKYFSFQNSFLYGLYFILRTYKILNLDAITNKINKNDEKMVIQDVKNWTIWISKN